MFSKVIKQNKDTAIQRERNLEERIMATFIQCKVLQVRFKCKVLQARFRYPNESLVISDN